MLRPATDADQDLVRRWRNHPAVRAVSLTRHEIGVEEHNRWWRATKRSTDRRVYVYERSGVPSGVVTFFDMDPGARSAWWGYYLDNDGLTERGELLPAWIQIQRAAKRLAFNELGLRVLEGEVIEANEAVRSFNRRNGFVEISSRTAVVDGSPTTVLHVRATKEPVS